MPPHVGWVERKRSPTTHAPHVGLRLRLNPTYSHDERQFMAAMHACCAAERDLQPVANAMDQWLAELIQALHHNTLDQHPGLHPDSPLARQAQTLHTAVEASEPRWAEQWNASRPAQNLAQAFDDKVILLVFGKFNAGKSSLCNFLAERFVQHGQRVRYFYLQNGHIIESTQRFQEGALETTAQLQGVCLGEKLVLLDTPGLHSRNGPNAALTQGFLDSADAVLWLSSSSSPGQVQELDELARELRRSKPLLPLITRSDYLEEDEIDGAIVKALCNKSAANRALQEADVAARTQEKLHTLGVDPQLLRPPVSVSVHAAHAQAQAALADAGFERLYQALQAIVEPALAYKQRKPAEVRLHHLQEQVLGSLNTDIAPALATLRCAIEAENDALAGRQSRLVQTVWREIVAELPTLLEDPSYAGDTQLLCEAVTAQLAAAFARALNTQVRDYVLPNTAPAPITPSLCHETALTGEHAAQATIYADDPQALYNALEHAVRSQVMAMADDALQACRDTLQELDRRAQRLQAVLATSGQSLRQIEQVVRASSQT